MLKLAIQYKEKLNKAHQNNIYNKENMYYSLNNWENHVIDIEDSDYYKLQFVSVDSNDDVIGYLTADLHREHNKISGIGSIAYNNNTLFKRDFVRFLQRLKDSPFNKIEWTCVKGNPAEKMYNKIIEKYNGRIVGIKKESVKLIDGNFYDVVLYELMLNDITEKHG